MSQTFKIQTQNNQDYLCIESNRVEECIDYYTRYNLYGISVITDNGFQASNLDCVSDFPNLKGLIVDDEITDLTAIHSQPNLEYLDIGAPKKPIDFALFTRLHTFRSKWSMKLTNIGESKSIKHLTLWSYKSKNQNLFELSNLKQLQYLKLVSTHIESLDGIEQFTNLGELNLHYLSKLNDISAIAALDKHLTRVKFENCKKIASYQPLAKCLALERLSMEKSANIQSLDFVQQLKKLKSVFWVRTKLAGDPNVVLEADHIERAVGTHAKFIKGTYESV